MWFSVVCTLIDNDTRHQSGQNLLRTVMTRIVVDKSTYHAKPHSICYLSRREQNTKTILLLTASGPDIYHFLTSEGYPDNYKRNFDNTSTYAIKGGFMKIFFHDFYVEYAPDCK